MVNGVSGYNVNPAFVRAAAGHSVVHRDDIEKMVSFLNGQPTEGIKDPSIGEVFKGTLPFMAVFGAVQAYKPIKNAGWNPKELARNFNSASPYSFRKQSVQAGKDVIKRDYGKILKKSVTVNTERGFVGKILDRIPGYPKLRATGFGQAMGKSGAGWMAAIDGVTKIFTDVVPTFKELGFAKGMKQLLKSGTQVVAGAGGWLAGDALGKGIGAAIGTLICPGLGTAIGTWVGGFMGGIVGSAIASKGAKAITGKNELAIVKEAQLKEVTDQIEADPSTKTALAQQTIEQANAILAQDPKNKDALTMKAAAEKVLAEEAAPKAQTQGQNVQQLPQTNPVFNIPAGIPSVPGFNGTGYDINQYQNNAQIPVPYQTNPFFAQQPQAALALK